MSADILTFRPRAGPPLHLDEAHLPSDHDDPDHHNERPHTAGALLLRPNGFGNLNRSNTSLFAPGSRNGSRSPSPARHPLGNGRPGLQRAKSDFGPRGQGRENVGNGEEGRRKEGEWGLRHGFETQLESEEYNRLLESVSGASYGQRDAGGTNEVDVELLHVLYGQEARYRWKPKGRQPVIRTA
jgi:hypothetical protein